MNTGIIVLGMPRGGTSLLADMVRRWGAEAGPEHDLLQADQWNPQGYWEYVPLKRLNDELLASVGANERVPPSNPALLEDKATDPYFEQKALALIAQMRASGNIWFWKDPRLAILLPFWKKLWQDVVYIVSVRHPLETIQSQQKMASAILPSDHVPISAGLLYWQYFMLTLLQNIESSPRKLFIAYDQLIQHPTAECERLCAFLDQQCGITADPEHRIEAMNQAVNGTLRHYQTSAALLEAPTATQEQKDLYRLLRRKIENPAEPLHPADFPLYAGWHDYLRIIDMLLLSFLQRYSASKDTNWHDLLGSAATT